MLKKINLQLFAEGDDTDPKDEPKKKEPKKSELSEVKELLKEMSKAWKPKEEGDPQKAKIVPIPKQPQQETQPQQPQQIQQGQGENQQESWVGKFLKSIW